MSNPYEQQFDGEVHDGDPVDDGVPFDSIDMNGMGGGMQNGSHDSDS